MVKQKSSKSNDTAEEDIQRLVLANLDCLLNQACERTREHVDQKILVFAETLDEKDKFHRR